METFDDIYEKYYKKLYVFLYRLCGDQGLAEELTQESLYKAFLHIYQYQGKSSLFTWLCQIGKNAWFDECTRQKRFHTLDETWDPESSYNLEQEVIQRQMLQILRRELMNLPEPYASVCALRIYAELSFSEIASEYGKSESWARVTFFRGKAMLTERMGEHHEHKT